MKICDFYSTIEYCVDGEMVCLISQCNGTLIHNRCVCGGDCAKCDFYPEVREKAQNETEVVYGEPVYRGYLSDWYINSVGFGDTPVWTEEHLEELFNDFYLIPKEDDYGKDI